MIDREAALKALRLDAEATREQIVGAYNKLARRYPLQQFPDRHSKILQAKAALLNPEQAFKMILQQDSVDLRWLNRYSKQNSNDSIARDKGAIDVKDCLSAMMRPSIKNNVNDPLSFLEQFL